MALARKMPRRASLSLLYGNAGLVVIEVGGMLPYGAVIAREVGMPYVVGIERVVTKLYDAQRLQVDRTVGIIRLLS